MMTEKSCSDVDLVVKTGTSDRKPSPACFGFDVKMNRRVSCVEVGADAWTTFLHRSWTRGEAGAASLGMGFVAQC